MVERILITGGSGFIGTNLVEYYVQRGAEVLNLDIAEPRNQSHVQHWQKADILDSVLLRERIKAFKPNFIFHMAARTDLDGLSADDYAANIVGVENIISSIESLVGLKRIVFASSRLVCRIGYQPTGELDYCATTPYGESKVLGEKIVRAASYRIPCSWAIVRPTSIWGPWFDIPYKTFFLTVAKGRYFHPGSTEIRKSFGFVGNTVHELHRLIAVGEQSVFGRTFYLADYPAIDVRDFANAIQDELGVSKIRSIPVVALRVAAMLGDAAKNMGYANPPLTSFRLDNLLTPMLHDLESLKSVVGELPYTMQQGVAATVSWLRQQKEIN